jgi:TPR repeat protein
MRKRPSQETLLIAVLLAALLGNIPAGHAQAPSPRGVALSAPQASVSVDRGVYYAMVIGIKNYQNLPKLETPLEDASAIADLLRKRYGFEVNLLLDASRHQILSALAEYRRKLQQNDNLLIYFAGHGQFDSAAGRGYWLPADAEPDDDANWIIADEITSSVRALAARHVLVVSDSCYSGTLTRSISSPIKPSDPTQYLQKMFAGKSRNLMSSGGNEPVADGGALGHSVFANAFLQGLTGMDEDAFTALDLFNAFVQRRVVGGSDQVPQYAPIPGSGDVEGDFVFFRLASSPAGGGTVLPASKPPAGTHTADPAEKPVAAYAEDLSKARQLSASGAYASALPIFQKAAQEGSPEAMVYVGEYFDSAEAQFSGIPKDDAQAVNWYRKAAEAGSAKGMGNLGSLYAAGRGVEQDTWQAMRWYRKAAEAGDVTAMKNLGRMYDYGTGIEPDYGQALTWLTKASEAGDAAAMIDIGHMYAEGRGVPADNTQAASWYGKAVASYRKAAEGGDVLAMMDLGGVYLSGREVKRDAAQALGWIRRAADGGSPKAAWSLGVRYERGLDVEKDLNQAANWYRKAAEAGYSPAMMTMGQTYENGTGVQKDQAEAAGWYRRAAEGGSLQAMVALGRMYQDGSGVEKNAAQAQSWFQKAAQTAEKSGAGTLMNLGNIYLSGSSGLKSDPMQAAVWYRRAADAGSATAMYSLGRMNESGTGMARDYVQAVSWYRRAAGAGYAQGMSAMGRMYQNGTGVEKDDAQALTWFRKAAVTGGTPAMYDVGRQYENGKDYKQAVSWYSKAAMLNYTPAMTALGYLYERGLGVDRDPAQAASWYRKAANAGDTNAAAKLDALSAKGVNSTSGSAPAPVAVAAATGPNFAGTWTEINPKDPAHPRKLVLQQEAGQITFAGFRLTISQGTATWTGPQGCAPQFQRSGYDYGSSAVAGTTTLKMSIQGSILVFEDDVSWKAPCNGHSVGIEQDTSRFQRAAASR